MKEDNKLPEGWKWVKLGEIAEINPKLPNREGIADDQEVQFLPMKLVEELSGKVHLEEYRKYYEVRKGYTAFINGDILFAKVTPCMENGKIAVANNLKNNIGFGSTEFHVIRTGQQMIPKYLFNYLVQDQFRKAAANAMTGAVGLRRVPKQFLENHVIPIPPKPLQQTIVFKIEELFSELDKGIDNLRIAQQQLKTYRQAVLNFLIPTANYRELGSLIYSLDQGWSPKCENQASENIKEWAVIKTSAVQHGRFLDFENKILPKSLKARTQHELKDGDLLITRAGPRVRVGVCCMIKKTRPKLINCDKVYRIKVNTSLITPEYFEIILNTPKCQREIEIMKTGINDSGLNLTQKAFLRIQIPLPTLQDQQIVVQELESRLSIADKMEESITQSLEQSEALRQSILKKAFEGKLV